MGSYDPSADARLLLESTYDDLRQGFDFGTFHDMADYAGFDAVAVRNKILSGLHAQGLTTYNQKRLKIAFFVSFVLNRGASINKAILRSKDPTGMRAEMTFYDTAWNLRDNSDVNGRMKHLNAREPILPDTVTPGRVLACFPMITLTQYLSDNTIKHIVPPGVHNGATIPKIICTQFGLLPYKADLEYDIIRNAVRYHALLVAKKMVPMGKVFNERAEVNNIVAYTNILAASSDLETASRASIKMISGSSAVVGNNAAVLEYSNLWTALQTTHSVDENAVVVNRGY